MPFPETESSKHAWTAIELRQLSSEQRDAIFAEAAALAEEECRLNPELTGFDAFGEADLYGESSDSTEHAR